MHIRTTQGDVSPRMLRALGAESVAGTCDLFTSGFTDPFSGRLRIG